MRTLTVRCVGCGKMKDFRAKDVDELCRKIDAAGWQENATKSAEGASCGGICPECLKKEEETNSEALSMELWK